MATKRPAPIDRKIYDDFATAVDHAYGREKGALSREVEIAIKDRTRILKGTKQKSK